MLLYEEGGTYTTYTLGAYERAFIRSVSAFLFTKKSLKKEAFLRLPLPDSLHSNRPVVSQLFMRDWVIQSDRIFRNFRESNFQDRQILFRWKTSIDNFKAETIQIVRPWILLIEGKQNLISASASFPFDWVSSSCLNYFFFFQKCSSSFWFGREL